MRGRRGDLHDEAAGLHAPALPVGGTNERHGLEAVATLQGRQLPPGELLDARLPANLLDDVVTCRERLRTMDQRHRRSGAGELERIEGAAVAASDHHHVTPGELLGPCLEQIGDVTSEGPVGCGGELLVARAGRNHQRTGTDARPADFDPALAEVGTRDRVREAEAIAEDDRGVLEGVTQAGAGTRRSGRHVADRVRDLDELSAGAPLGLEHGGVELDVHTFDRATHARDTCADDDDIAALVSVNRVGHRITWPIPSRLPSLSRNQAPRSPRPFDG